MKGAATERHTGAFYAQSLEIHGDRKSTRLNSSHRTISYAVFCLKKKNEAHGVDGDLGVSEKRTFDRSVLCWVDHYERRSVCVIGEEHYVEILFIHVSEMCSHARR